MKKKILGIILLTLILSVSLAMAFSRFYIEVRRPEDNAFWLLDGQNLTFNFGCSPLTSTNSTYNATLFHNISGTFVENFTENRSAAAGVQANFTWDFRNFTFYDSLTDGMKFIWGIRCANQSGNFSFSENRTIQVELAPNITIQTPLTNTSSSSTSVKLLINISGDGDYYRCFKYTNQSGANASNGTWGIMPGHSVVLNATATNITHIFQDNASALWNVNCFEGASTKIFGWGSNLTHTVSGTTMVVTLNAPSISPTNDNISVQINMTATSSMLDKCFFWLNSSLNATNTTPSSGTLFTIATVNLVEGDSLITVGCNDTAGRSVNATPLLLTVDTILPRMSNINNLTLSSCTKMGLTFNTTENLTSSSLIYGIATPTGTTNSNANDGQNERTHNITFNNNWEILHQLNFTMTDLAGNENSTLINVTTPVGVCGNLSVFSNYDSKNLTTIESEIGISDFLFWWNETGQNFLTKTNGTSTNGNFDLAAGDVLWVSSTDDGTWFRNKTITDLNVSEAINNSYIGLFRPFKFITLSNNTFRNKTGGNATSQGLVFEVLYYAGWNNTGQEWVTHTQGTSWENETDVGRSSNNTLDALWFSSNASIIVFINSTDDYVSGNWSG